MDYRALPLLRRGLRKSAANSAAPTDKTRAIAFERETGSEAVAARARVAQPTPAMSHNRCCANILPPGWRSSRRPPPLFLNSVAVDGTFVPCSHERGQDVLQQPSRHLRKSSRRLRLTVLAGITQAEQPRSSVFTAKRALRQESTKRCARRRTARLAHGWYFLDEAGATR